MESITELYCLIDDFYKMFEESWKHHVLTDGQRKRWRMTGISLPEMMTLVVLFHQLRHRQFKVFYLSCVHQHLRSEFPRLPSYTRMVALLPKFLSDRAHAPSLARQFHRQPARRHRRLLPHAEQTLPSGTEGGPRGWLNPYPELRLFLILGKRRRPCKVLSVYSTTP